MSEPKFKKGDKVLINGGIVATIVTYDADPDANILVYETQLAGGATDTATAHVNNTRIEPFVDQSADLHADKPGKSKRDAVTNDSGVEDSE